MGNRVKIKGNKNIVVQDSGNRNKDSRKGWSKPQKVMLWIGVLGVVLSVIVGWDAILNFFGI